MKLELELIPEKQWHKSLANLLPKPVWDSLRREVYQEFGYSCAICGAVNCRVNCHEVWEFDDRKKIQKLVAFKSLCDHCHNIKHWGRTVALVHQGEYSSNYLEKLTQHFCEVNQCSVEDFERHKVEAGDTWLRRSKYKYKLDWGKFSPDKVTKVWMKRNRI